MTTTRLHSARKTRLLAVAALLGALAASTASAQTVVYREIFPNTAGTDQSFTANANGWGLRTTGGVGVSGTAGDVRGINGNPVALANVNAVTVSSDDRGFVRIFNGAASGIYAYTTEYGSLNVSSLGSVSWYQGNQNTSDTLQVLLTIGGTTYISDTGFTNATGLASSANFPTDPAVVLKTLTIAGSTWSTLSAEPNTLGTSTTISGTSGLSLPTSGLITGFGLYAASFADSAVSPNGQVRFDNFTLTSIPEPSAFAGLAGVAALGLVALRRRRA